MLWFQKNALYFGFRSKLNDGVPDTFVVGVSICMSLDFNHHTLYCNQAHCFTGDKLGCVKALRRNIKNSAVRDNVSTRLQVTSLVCLLVCLRDQIKADRQLGLVTTATRRSCPFILSEQYIDVLCEVHSLHGKQYSA